MSEPILERLSQFTPDAGRLDRDALLFAAGRSSARPNRGWMTLASVLAGTQALSLAFLWSHATPPAANLSRLVASAPVPPTMTESAGPDASANPGAWSARQRVLESDTETLPASDVTFIESEPPLRAFASSRSILN